MITADDLRARHYRDPFEPFHLVLNDGRELLVRKRTHFGISPLGNQVVYAPLIEDFEIIPMTQIAELRPAEPATAGAA